MDSIKFRILGKHIRIYKEPWKPFVFGEIDFAPFRFSIENDTVTLVSGKIDPDVLDGLKVVIAQYFLPLGRRKKKPPRESSG